MDVLSVILCFVSVGLVYNQDAVEDKRVKALIKERGRYQRVRCSRRYTPGSCLDPVRPVWTFVAPLQDCTERLGCPAGLFTNRYNTHEECTSMCRDLVYLYMYLQSLDNDTFRLPDEALESSTRPARVDVMYSEIMQDHLEDPNSEELADRDDAAREDYRRKLLDELENLPESNLDYSVERPYGASHHRPPSLTRQEFLGDQDNVPLY